MPVLCLGTEVNLRKCLSNGWELDPLRLRMRSCTEVNGPVVVPGKVPAEGWVRVWRRHGENRHVGLLSSRAPGRCRTSRGVLCVLPRRTKSHYQRQYSCDQCSAQRFEATLVDAGEVPKKGARGALMSVEDGWFEGYINRDE